MGKRFVSSGTQGRKPTPTKLRILRGQAAPHKLVHGEPEPRLPPAPPDPPAVLKGYGREEWIRLAHELCYCKLLSHFDIYPLAAYCRAYHDWRTAVEKLDEVAQRDPLMAGLIIRTQKGGVMQNPLHMTVRQCANDMVRYANEFGFTPASRSRISSDEASRTTGNKFDGLLGGYPNFERAKARAGSD
jgi:P27 family predicted phage terminase small subunit